jgi:hypothetical protein
MKLAIINDTHFGARGDNLNFNEFFFKFWENIFFPYLEKHDIKTVIHLGDVVDRRKFINHNIANDFQNRFIKRLISNNIDTHILIGNHDTYFKNTNKVNAIKNLCGMYNELHIYEDPIVVEFDELPILLMPWICEDNLDKSMDLLHNAPVEIVFGHFDITGFEMDRGNVSHEGLSRNLFERYDMVLSGHFHHRSTDGTIFYLGNQYEMTWNDYNDQRGFHVFDTETRQLEFIPNPYKMFHKVTYDDTVQNHEYWQNQNIEAFKDSMVKIIVVNKQNPFLFDTVIDSFYKAGTSNINIVEDLVDVVGEEEEEEIGKTEDTITILSNHIDSLSLNVNNVKLKALMKELYVEALNTENNA